MSNAALYADLRDLPPDEVGLMLDVLIAAARDTSLSGRVRWDAVGSIAHILRATKTPAEFASLLAALRGEHDEGDTPDLNHPGAQ